MMSWFLMSEPSVSAKICRSVIRWMPLGWWVVWMKIGLDLGFFHVGFLLIPVISLWTSTKICCISDHFHPQCSRCVASRCVMCK